METFDIFLSQELQYQIATRIPKTITTVYPESSVNSYANKLIFLLTYLYTNHIFSMYPLEEELL